MLTKELLAAAALLDDLNQAGLELLDRGNMVGQDTHLAGLGRQIDLYATGITWTTISRPRSRTIDHLFRSPSRHTHRWICRWPGRHVSYSGDNSSQSNGLDMYAGIISHDAHLNVPDEAW